LQNTHVATTKTTFSLYELAKESKALYETIAKDKQSTIDITMSESLTVDMDKNVLLLILRNLIDNAIKHGKSNKITIKGRLEAHQVVIEVINNNTVFSAEKLAALQQQIRQRSDGIHEGRGLGLYLVTHFVQQQNGRLTVESSAEEGVTFKVQMPTLG
jgi:signal transduction histidine kinase